jgi:phospholipase/carboxylesterase
MSSLLPAIELETASNPDASIIWMHGLGADGNDFVPIVDEMELPVRPIRFVFPHAPVKPVTINGGFEMRAWYDVVSDDFSRREDEAGVRESQGMIESLIRRENERGIPARQIVLAGFSQGGAMALHTGLRYPERLAGVLALSSYVPVSKTLAPEVSDANRDVPIFMAHGTGDPVIPLVLAGASRQLLERLGYDVQWHEYGMGHSVIWEEVADLSRWLRDVLRPPKSEAG